MLEIIYNYLEEFIATWQKSPFEWNKEIDIQVEIANGIKAIYKKHNADKINWNYRVGIKGFEEGQTYSTVCCEYPTYYLWPEDLKRYVCCPDIIIYEDLSHVSNPPDVALNSQDNWPMFWICEIKYWTDENICFEKSEAGWDIEKMKYLLNQEDGTRYACWLNIHRERASAGNGLSKKMSCDNRLVEYDVRLAAI